MKLILEMLEKDPIKTPTTTRDQIMHFSHESWKEQGTFLQNKRDNPCTKEHLASTKFTDLTGKEMLEFREQHLSSKPVATLN